MFGNQEKAPISKKTIKAIVALEFVVPLPDSSLCSISTPQGSRPLVARISGAPIGSITHNSSSNHWAQMLEIKEIVVVRMDWI